MRLLIEKEGISMSTCIKMHLSMPSAASRSRSSVRVYAEKSPSGSNSATSSRRVEIESARKALLKRIQTDIRRIGEEEKSYSSELIKEIIPVRVSFKKEVLDRLKDAFPIKVEIVKKNTGGVKSVSAEVVSDAELDV